MDKGLDWIPHYSENAHIFSRLRGLLDTAMDFGEHVLIAGYLNTPQYLIDNLAFPVLRQIDVVLEEDKDPVAVVQLFGRSARPGNAWMVCFYKTPDGSICWFSLIPGSASSSEQASLLVQLAFPFMRDEGERFARVMKLAADKLAR